MGQVGFPRGSLRSKRGVVRTEEEGIELRSYPSRWNREFGRIRGYGGGEGDILPRYVEREEREVVVRVYLPPTVYVRREMKFFGGI